MRCNQTEEKTRENGDHFCEMLCHATELQLLSSLKLMVFLVVSLLLTFKAGQGLICSFSCDTVTAVTTNVESTKYQRRENGGIGYKQHSRAGTS